MKYSHNRSQSGIPSRAGIIALAIACSTALLVLIARAAVNTPFVDEFQFGYLYNPIAHNELPALRDIVAAHNGHPYTILKSLLTLTLLLGIPWSALMYAQVPVLAATFLLVAKRLPAGTKAIGLIAVIGLAVTIITPRQWENLYWAMQFAFPLSLLFSLGAFHFASRYSSEGSTGTLAGALACSFIASLCNGAGIFACLLAAVALLANRQRQRPWHVGLIGGATLGTLALYLLSQGLSPTQAVGSKPLPLLATADHAVRMLASGVFDFSQSNPLGFATGALLALTVLWCVFHALKAWRDHTFELLCFAFGGILIAGVTYARLRAGIFQPDAPRYVPLVMPVVIGTILVLHKMGNRTLLAALVSLLCIGYGSSLFSEWRATPYRRDNLQQSQDSLCQQGGTGGVSIPPGDVRSIQQLFCTSQARSDGAAAAGMQGGALHVESREGMLTATLPTPTCESRQEAVLDWNATASGLQSVEIWVGTEGSDKLFTIGGQAGTGNTGPWVTPGAIFTLRRPQRGVEIDRLVIPGSPCAL